MRKPRPDAPVPRTPGPPSAVAACHRKVAYRSKRRALEMAAIRMGEGAPPLEPYKCDQGRHWHLRQAAEAWA